MSDPLRYELAVVRIFVRDWERALDFYTETLGMPLESRLDAFGWAELDLAGSRLAIERLAEDDEEAAALVGRYTGVSLRVDDVAAVHAELVRRGVSFEGEPALQPWGGVLAHLRDPEGNVVTLVGPPPEGA